MEFKLSMEKYGFHLSQLFVQVQNEKVLSLYASRLLPNGSLCVIYDCCELHYLFCATFLIFCHTSVYAVFNFLLVQSHIVEFKLVTHRIVTAVWLATQAQQFSESNFFLDESRFSFIRFFFICNSTSQDRNCSKCLQ